MTSTSETQSTNKTPKEKLRQLRISFYKTKGAKHLWSVWNANIDKNMMYCWLNSGLFLLSDCSWNAAVLLHDSCQCVLSARFIAPEPGGFTRDEGSPSMKESADAGPKLTASQYANSLFIYLFLNDPQVQAKRVFFSVDLKKKKCPFFLEIICHWHIKVRELQAASFFFAWDGCLWKFSL